MKNVRITFSKTGRAKFISHLDLNRAMIRALRRAAVPVWYTEGFNRHPYVTFAAPLSLGYEGLAESMDLRLEQDMPLDELVSRLNAVMPEGLTVTGAAEAVMKPGDLQAARYRLTFSGGAHALRRLLEQDSLPVEKRTKKGGTKTVDLKPALREIRITAEGDTAQLEVTLPCGSTDNLNPGLLLTLLQQQTGDETLKMSVIRLKLYGADGQIFA